MTTSKERYEELLAAARARAGQSGDRPAAADDETVALLTRAIELRAPSGDEASLSEDDVKKRIAPLVRAHADMEGTGRGFVPLFGATVTRAIWPTVANVVRRVLQDWEDALESVHGPAGPSFVAELGYRCGRGVVREGRARGSFGAVDDVAALTDLMARFERHLEACAVTEFVRPLTETPILEPLRALFSARRSLREITRYGPKARVGLLGEPIPPGDNARVHEAFDDRVVEHLRAWSSALGEDHGEVGLAFLAELAYHAGAADGLVDLSLARDGDDRLTLRAAAERLRMAQRVPASIDWDTLFDHVENRAMGLSGEPLAHALDAAAAPFTEAEVSELSKRGRAKAQIENPMTNRWWPASWLSFLAWAGGGDFTAGGLELSPMFTPGEAREYLLAYDIPTHLPGAIPFAMDGSGGFYLFDAREGLLGNELAVVYCHSTETDGWHRVEHLAPSFYELCMGRAATEG